MAPRMVVPAGKTFFEELKFTYSQVEVTDAGKINTSQFLEATENFIKLFRRFKPLCYARQYWLAIDIAEGLAFTVVEKDMVGNIAVCDIHQ